MYQYQSDGIASIVFSIKTNSFCLFQHAHSRTAVRVSRRIKIMHVLLKEPYVRARKEPVEAL